MQKQTIIDNSNINLTFNELTFLRSALDPITIQGRDAKFVVELQIKLEQEIEKIKTQLQNK